MIILTHVVIALLSIASSSYLLFSPSRTRLYASYTLVALTLTSGTYLVFSTGTHMLEACVTGLVYTGFVSTAIGLAHKKLVSAEANNSRSN